MKSWCLALGLLTAATSGVAWAAEGAAEKSFAQGKTLLAQGELDGALKAFAAAARADQGNRDYLQQYALLRQVVELERRLQTEQDAEQAEYLSRAVFSYFANQGLYGRALEVARKAYQRRPAAGAALMVAEMALSTDQPAVAAETLASLPEAEVAPVTQALLGVALARQGKLEEARKIAAGVRVPESAEPPTSYGLARLYAAVGDRPAAVAALRQCFEQLPPSRQEGFRQHALKCQEFAGMASAAEFTAALATASAIPESKCSSGSNCSSCPMRGKCPGSAAAP